MALTKVQGEMLAAVHTVVGQRITSAQTITTTGTIIYNSAIDDPFSMLNTGTGVITVDKAGVWLVFFIGELNGVTAGTGASFAVQKNGSGTSMNVYPAAYFGGATTCVGYASRTMRLAAGDTLQIVATGDASFTVDNALANEFGATWLGP